jgi:HPt (histidine-containing phosphotransfer) domain-containing protein
MDYLENDYLREITNNDPAILSRLVLIFITETPKSILKIEHYLEEEDMNGLKTALHKIKSGVRTFQIKHIDQLITEAENLIKENNVHLTKEVVKQLVNSLNKETDALKSKFLP